MNNQLDGNNKNKEDNEDDEQNGGGSGGKGGYEPPPPPSPLRTTYGPGGGHSKIDKYICENKYIKINITASRL